jgi:hypothetical protein
MLHHSNQSRNRMRRITHRTKFGYKTVTVPSDYKCLPYLMTQTTQMLRRKS